MKKKKEKRKRQVRFTRDCIKNHNIFDLIKPDRGMSILVLVVSSCSSKINLILTRACLKISLVLDIKVDLRNQKKSGYFTIKKKTNGAIKFKYFIVSLDVVILMSKKYASHIKP